MESSLHRQLKTRFGSAPGGSLEASVAGYRIDAIESSGTLVEVQSAPLSSLRGKVEHLLNLGHELRVVKPMVRLRQIAWMDRRRTQIVSQRKSPKQGQMLDIFDELVSVARWLPEPHFSLELLAVDIIEQRVPRRRRPGYSVVDRVLVSALNSLVLENPSDLWKLIPTANLPEVFTTRDLASSLGRPLHFAQRVAYCLRTSAAVRTVGRNGRFHQYRRAPELRPAAE